jgi:hypothetical protein
VAASVHIGNRCSTRALKGTTPYEAYYGKKPWVNDLRVFGCVAYVHVPSERRRKLDDAGTPCHFVGYAKDTKGYMFWSPSHQRILISRDTIFDENRFDLQGETARSRRSTPSPAPIIIAAPLEVVPRLSEVVGDEQEGGREQGGERGQGSVGDGGGGGGDGGNDSGNGGGEPDVCVLFYPPRFDIILLHYPIKIKDKSYNATTTEIIAFL